MPKIDREQVCVAFDMRGCPNRCRHCWLGHADNRLLSEADVRWGVSQFRDFIAKGNTPIKKLSVATWFREPDFGDDVLGLKVQFNESPIRLAECCGDSRGQKVYSSKNDLRRRME